MKPRNFKYPFYKETNTYMCLRPFREFENLFSILNKYIGVIRTEWSNIKREYTDMRV